MLLAFVGVTGIGKSYFTEKIVKELGFQKVHTIRTRAMRPGEKNGETGIFITEEELEQLKKEGKIIYDFKVFGGSYAYKKDEILSDKNTVFEMHYTTINDWKKVKPDIVTIYIFPSDIKKAEAKTKERNMPIEKEKERIKEINEQYEKVYKDKEFQKMFDYVVYNNYDKESEDNIVNLVKNILNKR